MSRGRRKVSAMIAALAACAIGVAACSPQSSKSKSGDPEHATLNLWSWQTGHGIEAEYQKVFKVFEDKHPGIKINIRGIKGDTYDTVLRTGLSGSDGPDIVQLRSYGGMATLADTGALVPLDGQVSGLDSWPANIIDGARDPKDKKIYGVPFAVQTMNVLYNKDLFAKEGIQPPTTWAEMVAICEKLQADGITPFAAGFKSTWMLPILREIFGASDYAGPQFQQDLLNGTKTFTDPAYTKANQSLLSMKQYFPKQASTLGASDAETLFASGKAAMYPGGIWEVNLFAEQAPDLKIGLFNAPPHTGTTTYAPGYVDGSFGINAKSSKRKAAMTLVNWIASKEFGKEWADVMEQISAVPGVEPSNPLVAAAAQAYAKNPAPYLTYVSFAYGTPSGVDLEYSNLQKMMLGKIPPSSVGKAVEAGVSQWFKP